MEEQTRKSMHPLTVGAAVAIIVFCVAGVAAIMGWVPTTIGHPGESASPPRADKAAPTPTSSSAARPRVEPARPARTMTAAAVCPDCGVVESVREIESPGKASGVGAVGGAVVGGVVGNQVGGGRGRDVMTVLGAVGGALAGNQIEKNVNKTKSYAITVRLEDGTTRVLHEATQPTWRPGDRVRIVDGRLQANA